MLFLAAVVAGCGGVHDRIDGSVAERLARQADSVAVSLERRDGCAAAREARGLRSEVSASIDRGEIPKRLRQPLRASVASLLRRIVCPPPAVAPPPPPVQPADEGDHDEGHGKGKGHGKGHGWGKR